jgi:hypothetical protein
MNESNVQRLFISYSHLDDQLVKPITELLRVTGTIIFRDKEGISPGKQWRLVIQDALDTADAILVFWSANSSKSTEVESEYKKEISKGKVVIPVLLDDTPLNSQLSQYQYIDFRPVVLNTRGSMNNAVRELGREIHERILANVYCPNCNTYYGVVNSDKCPICGGPFSNITPPTIVDGSHSAEGVENIIGLDIQGPAIIKPGTKSTARGFRNVTGTRIGGGKEENR